MTQEFVVLASLLCQRLGETVKLETKTFLVVRRYPRSFGRQMKMFNSGTRFVSWTYSNSKIPTEAVYKVLSCICLVLYPGNVIGKEFQMNIIEV